MRLLLALALLASAPAARAEEEHKPFPLFPYENQGKFVTEPAKFVAQLPYEVVFLAGAFVCLPGSLLQDRKLEDPIPRDQEISVICGRKAGMVVAWPVYAAVGLPFFILKGMFWTGPRALFHHDSEKGKSERPDPKREQ